MPLSPVVLNAWLAMEGRDLSALERQAVVAIDLALRGNG